MSQISNNGTSLPNHHSRNSIFNDHLSINNNSDNKSSTTSSSSNSRALIKEKYKDLLMERISINPSHKDNETYNTQNNNTNNKLNGGGADKDYHIDENDLKYNDLDYLDDTDDSDLDYSYDKDKRSETSDGEDDENITLDEDGYVSGDYDLNESFDYDYDSDRSYPGVNPEYVQGSSITSIKSFFNLRLAFLSFLIVSGIFYFIRMGETGNNNPYSSPLQTSGSITNIQKQINHLYNELNLRDKKWNNEFDSKLKIVISQFEKNIKNLLPNKNFIKNFQDELNSINSKINFLQDSFNNNYNDSNLYPNSPLLQNFTYFQNEVLNELNHSLPVEIPVMINNSSSIMIIPELHTYITKLLSNLIKNSTNKSSMSSSQRGLDDLKLKYDLNKYIKEILTNEFQYVDKNFLLNELNNNLRVNKLEILNELRDNIKMELNKYGNNYNYKSNNNDFPERYSTVLLKRLINQIYDTNQHQWGNDLDFMTFAQGTRLLRSLTSNNSPIGSGITPMQLLADTKIDSMSTYWQSQPDSSGKVTIGIRFKEPIYLTKVSYLHGRFTNNLHMMNSAPREISIYVKLVKDVDTKNLQNFAKQNNEGELFSKDKSFIKIKTYEYNIFDKRIKQNFLLPYWFIKFKPLVKSMIFEINSNYGNKDYISLKKFIVNGVTETDLSILKSKSFPIYDYRDDGMSSPEYHFDYNHENIQQQFKIHNIQKESTENNNNKNMIMKKGVNTKKIPSFGEDEVV